MRRTRPYTCAQPARIVRVAVDPDGAGAGQVDGRARAEFAPNALAADIGRRMTDATFSPAEQEIATAITDAGKAGEPLLVCGNGTKRSMLRPVQAARRISTSSLTGITLYAPKELIISARAGTPLPDIEAALAENGQHLIAEPPDLTALLGADVPASGVPQTIGGIVATNLSGPRRVAWGAMRDHVMGIRAVNGAGEVIHSGGRVLKNVTGLDLCKLLSGSHGTLAVITEVTLKVLPAPETTGVRRPAGPRCRARGRRAVGRPGLALRRVRRRLAARRRAGARAGVQRIGNRAAH